MKATDHPMNSHYLIYCNENRLYPNGQDERMFVAGMWYLDTFVSIKSTKLFGVEAFVPKEDV